MLGRILRLGGVILLTAGLCGACAKATSGGGDGRLAGLSAAATVAGGTVMTSSNYRLVLTGGEAPGGNRIMSSGDHRMQGGLVGVTERPSDE